MELLVPYVTIVIAILNHHPEEIALPLCLLMLLPELVTGFKPINPVRQLFVKPLIIFGYAKAAHKTAANSIGKKRIKRYVGVWAK